jgi:hypothetical protein
MAEKLDLREWVEQEIPLVAAVAESRRLDPTSYKAAVDSIYSLLVIKSHAALPEISPATITIQDIIARQTRSDAQADETDAPVDGDTDDAPEPEPTLEKSDVRAKLVELKNAGLNLKELWDKFGVTGLSGVDPKDYRKLLKTAEELSA